jgi:hypothetical protein
MGAVLHKIWVSRSLTCIGADRVGDKVPGSAQSLRDLALTTTAYGRRAAAQLGR